MNSDFTALLIGLLDHYSPTGREVAAVDYLINQMNALGFVGEKDACGNAIGTRGAGPNEIILLGHIDTVPGVIEVRREGEILHGRGAVDAKGPLACFVAAASQVSIPQNWRITVIGALAEEGDSHGARYLLDRYTPEAVVIGEPSSWDRITLGYKGSTWFTYTIQRPLTHSAARVSNACEISIQFWSQIQAMANDFNTSYAKAFDQLLPTLRDFSTTDDGFTQLATLRIGISIPPTIEAGDLLRIVHELAGEAKITVEDCIPPFRSEKNNPLVRGFLNAIREHGGSPAFTVKTGTSDMNLVGPVWKCPIVAYGPGDSNLDHTPEEHILIPEYLNSIHVLTLALEQTMTNWSASEIAKKQGKKSKPEDTLVSRDCLPT